MVSVLTGILLNRLTGPFFVAAMSATLADETSVMESPGSWALILYTR